MSATPAAIGRQPNPVQAFGWTLLAAMRVQQRIWASNVILLIRRPVTPVLIFLATWLAYDISGQTAVPEDRVIGFLIVGTLASQAWDATVWACGFSLQMDAFRGTLPSIFASPASRLAVVLGYGTGDLVVSFPAVLVTLGIGVALGADSDVADPVLALVCLLLLFVSALAIGVACSGLFILSRNANPLANFLQTPVYILAGFYFPRSVLPDWLEPVGGLLPITHALEAFRATMLSGARLSDVADELVLTLLMSGVFLAVGIWSMGRVDHELRRSGSLNLF